MKTTLLILMALFASCAVLTAQDAKPSDSGSTKASDQHGRQPSPKAAAKSSQMPQLQDATPPVPVESASPSLLKDAGPKSIEDAARKAAHDLATAGASTPQAKGGDPAKTAQAAQADKKDDGASAPSGVGEFHTVPDGTSRSSANPMLQKDGSPANRIHGQIYGGGGPAGRAGSESVGATSKSGKTSVYVQSDQASSTVAPPQ